MMSYLHARRLLKENGNLKLEIRNLKFENERLKEKLKRINDARLTKTELPEELIFGDD